MKKLKRKKINPKTQPNKIKVNAQREKTKKTLKRVEKSIFKKPPEKKSPVKPNKIRTTKLTSNPLFIRFLNWGGDAHAIHLFLEAMSNSFQDSEDKDIVENKIVDELFLNNLTAFQKALTGYLLETIQGKTVGENFLQWLNNTYTYLEESIETYLEDEIRTLSIKDSEGRWFESVICYNFIMTFNYFGAEILKRCPICSSFFCHKGKYAKYCGESCKEKGMKKV